MLTLTLPFALGLAFISEIKGIRFVFVIASVLAFHTMSTFWGLTALAVTGCAAVDILMRILFYLFGYYYLKTRFVHAVHVIMGQMKRGWLLLTILPLAYYCLFYGMVIFYRDHGQAPEHVPALFFAAFALSITYGLIELFLIVNQLRLAGNENQALLESQVGALAVQLDVSQKVEEKLRIRRHDERHLVATLYTLLSEGNYQAAMEMLQKLDESLEEKMLQRYCENLTVNAILALYLDKAREEGIIVQARLDIPHQLQVDALELSTVFANAIENARNACAKEPADKPRFIRVICISSPQLVLEIANTCTAKVTFDEKGYPISLRKDHGLGTRSIAAFVRKYNAVIDYRLEDGVFQLCILLPKS